MLKESEHIRKVLPPIIEKRNEVLHVQHGLQGHCYDMEYGVQALKAIQQSEQIFLNIQEIMKSSIFLRQQINYEENRKDTKKHSAKSTLYKRFSAHLALDLSELPDLSVGVRDTRQRMDTTNLPCGGRHEISAPLNLGDLQRSHTTLH